MNTDYRYVLLEGNVNNIIKYIEPVLLKDYDVLRIKTAHKQLFMYHAFNKERLVNIWQTKPSQEKYYYIINLTEEEENKIVALLAIGLKLFNILKDMYGVFPLNGYVDECNE